MVFVAQAICPPPLRFYITWLAACVAAAPQWYTCNRRANENNSQSRWIAGVLVLYLSTSPAHPTGRRHVALTLQVTRTRQVVFVPQPTARPIGMRLACNQPPGQMRMIPKCCHKKFIKLSHNSASGCAMLRSWAMPHGSLTTRADVNGGNNPPRITAHIRRLTWKRKRKLHV